jgi:hypothetical protein
MGARLFLALVLAMPIGAFCQTFNGNFETLQPNGLPLGWSIADASGAATTSDAHLGKKAVKAWVYKNYESGRWIGSTTAAAGNASQISGYYKYLGDKKECTKATVSYLLGAKSAQGGIDTLAYGDVELKLNKEYSKFDFDVAAKGSGTPEFMNIQLKPAGHCDIHGATNCCFLFVDDVILAGSTQLPTPEEVPADEVAPAEEASPAEETAPMEEVVPTEETAPIEEAMPTEEGTPIDGGENESGFTREDSIKSGAIMKRTGADKETSPAEEEEVPAEEESTEPIDEGWKSEEESADDGGFR